MTVSVVHKNRVWPPQHKERSDTCCAKNMIYRTIRLRTRYLIILSTYYSSMGLDFDIWHWDKMQLEESLFKLMPKIATSTQNRIY